MRDLRWRALLLAPEACFWLLVSWLTLDVLRGAQYRRLIPKPASASGPPPVAPSATEADPASLATQTIVRQVRHAVWAVSRRMPVRSVCFHRAIAAHRMLRARGIVGTMHYGIARRTDGSLHAHVWLTHKGADVVGTRDAEGFTEIATLAPALADTFRSHQATETFQ